MTTRTQPAPTDMRSDWDLHTFMEAEVEADRRAEQEGGRWVAVDRGGHTFPRYSVTRVPEVGDAVSYAFNGDSYPDGKVVRVTKTQITTDTGKIYRRKGLTAAWKSGSWTLVLGHEHRWNPEV